jgi:hypothetical protein
MTRAAFGRELECTYSTWSTTLWPSHKRCRTYNIDYSAKFETEKHSFTGDSSEKSETKTFRINESPKVEFIPLNILTEFPNLNALVIINCHFPTLKAGLFKPEFKKIEFLNLVENKIELIEPNAFQYLINLKWIGLHRNNLHTLPNQIFKNNPELIFISFWKNIINSIHPSAFDGLNKLKKIELNENLCIKKNIGCGACSISQTDLKKKLEKCFDNCSQGSICQFLYKTSKIEENEAEHSPIFSESLELVLRDSKKAVEGVEEKLIKTSEDLGKKVESLSGKMETELELGRKTTKEAIETNNQKTQETCASNQQAVEKLKESIEETKTCTPGNQLQQSGESTQLLAAQLEVT